MTSATRSLFLAGSLRNSLCMSRFRDATFESRLTANSYFQVFKEERLTSMFLRQHCQRLGFRVHMEFLVNFFHVNPHRLMT